MHRVGRTISLALAIASFLLASAPAGNAETSGSATRALQAGLIDVGGAHACAVLPDGGVRCWGRNNFGQLGQGNTSDIGDNEAPSTVPPVKLGAGRTARAVATGTDHTCALLDDGSVRCWGRNNVGQLGQGNTSDIGDNETPDTVPPVQLGTGRRAVAIAAGNQLSCALLDDQTVRCWGSDTSGKLGNNGLANIGDNETPAAAPLVGLDLPALAISAGSSTHACALLEGGKVSCWGEGSFGALGYGNTDTIGDDEDPQDAGYVFLGVGRTAKAITTGAYDSCAILDTDELRCWGYGQYGRVGIGNTNTIGDSESPAAAPVLDFGAGHKVQAVSGGGVFTPLAHACAILDDGSLRCWGHNPDGQLGYGQITDIGDNEFAGAGGPVSLGSGRTVSAVAAGDASTCALLDDGAVRCWGSGTFGRLGNGSVEDVGDNELPGTPPAPDLGATLLGAVGDASLTLTADAPTRPAGSVVQLTATLSASGLDALPLPAVRLTLPAGLELVAATPSAGSFAGGVWSLTSLASGQSATLAVTARVSALGALIAGAELTAAGPAFRDTDSTPGNGLAFEDDQASVSVTGLPVTTGGPGPGSGNVAPVLSKASLSRRVFAVGPKPTAPGAKRLPRGTVLRFTLSEGATVKVRIERLERGRRSRGRCIAVRRGSTGGVRCTRARFAGTLTRFRLSSGAHSIAFSGRIGRRALAPGSYRMTLSATDEEGLTGVPRKLAFTIRRA